MPTVAELQIVIEAQDRASAQLRGLGADVQRVERQVEGAGGAFGRLRGAISGLGQLGLAAGGIGAIVDGFQRVAGAIGGVVQQASDLNEQLSRAGVIFGDAAGQVVDFSRTTAQALGITQTEALEAAGSFGTLFRTAGLSEDAAAGMSTTLVGLAADLASFNNIDPSDALERLRSGLVGEAEPLRTVGVLLNETAVQQEALRLGLVQNTKDLTEAQKVQARYSLILQQTRTAQGDFARTSTGLANAQRILRASWADITTQLGQSLLPTVARVASFLAQQMPAALAAVQRATDTLGPALAALFSGDFQGALERVVALVGAAGAALAPQLATWTQAFLTWVQEMTPRLLQFLGERLGDLWAWIRETAPGLLETAIGTWIPAFVRWVDAVGPQILAALIQMLSELGRWIRDTAAPQMLAFGQELGAALVRGLGQALGQLGPAIDEALNQNPLLRAVLMGSPLTAGLLPGARGAAAPVVSQAAAVAGAAGRVHVEIRGVNVVVGMDPETAAREAGEQVRREVYDALTTSQAVTDPGASPTAQGSGR